MSSARTHHRGSQPEQEEDGMAAIEDAPDAGRVMPAGSQGLLFTDDLPELSEDTGYRGPTACKAAGITYRQLDYWARTGLVRPSVKDAKGSGSQRLYSFQDLAMLRLIKRMLDSGVNLQQVRKAMKTLKGLDQPALGTTLVSDGHRIYQVESPEAVVDLLASGQGVFAIAVDKVWTELEGTLAKNAGKKGRSARAAGGA
jgi:DNA-binding transcriptional MerR regulator